MVASFQRVDTCAAEFQADTPYMYSSYDGSDECEPTNNKKVHLDPNLIPSSDLVFDCNHKAQGRKVNGKLPGKCKETCVNAMSASPPTTRRCARLWVQPWSAST